MGHAEWAVRDAGRALPLARHRLDGSNTQVAFGGLCFGETESWLGGSWALQRL